MANLRLISALWPVKLTVKQIYWNELYRTVCRHAARYDTQTFRASFCSEEGRILAGWYTIMIFIWSNPVSTQCESDKCVNTSVMLFLPLPHCRSRTALSFPLWCLHTCRPSSDLHWTLHFDKSCTHMVSWTYNLQCRLPVEPQSTCLCPLPLPSWCAPPVDGRHVLLESRVGLPCWRRQNGAPHYHQKGWLCRNTPEE